MTRRASDLVIQWNKTVKVGDEVVYRSHPGADPQLFKTRTEAQVLSGHTAVVWLDGKSGCVAVVACLIARRALA
jgi:hypothetical protein